MINSAQIQEIWTKKHQILFRFAMSEKKGQTHTIKITFTGNLFISKN